MAEKSKVIYAEFGTRSAPPAGNFAFANVLSSIKAFCNNSANEHNNGKFQIEGVWAEDCHKPPDLISVCYGSFKAKFPPKDLDDIPWFSAKALPDGSCLTTSCTGKIPGSAKAEILTRTHQNSFSAFSHFKEWTQAAPRSLRPVPAPADFTAPSPAGLTR